MKLHYDFGREWYRVDRGSSWTYGPLYAFYTDHNRHIPTLVHTTLGVRLICEVR